MRARFLSTLGSLSWSRYLFSLQEHAVASQAVTSVANKLDTSNRVISSKSQEHIVVRESGLLGLVESLGGPGSLDGIVILVIANVYRLVDVVSDKLGLNPELGV